MCVTELVQECTRRGMGNATLRSLKRSATTAQRL